MSKKKNAKEKKLPDHVSRRMSDQAWLHKFIFVTTSVLVGLAALYIPYVLFFESAPVKHLELSDTASLKEVFFGGDPWLVACIPPKGGVLNPVITTAASSLSYDGINVASVNCSGVLPSGKTVAERFKLTEVKSKTAFVCVDGKRATQVPKKTMKTSDALVPWVRAKSQLKVRQFTGTAQLKTQCLKQKMCLLVVKDGELTPSEAIIIRKVGLSRRLVAYGVIDSSKQSFSLTSRFPKDRDPTVPTVVLIKAAANGTDSDSGTSVQLHKGTFGVSSLQSAIDGAANDDAPFTALKKLYTCCRCFFFAAMTLRLLPVNLSLTSIRAC
eukprot:m.978484 g.978484  ORF g.978484 m.978484 type:complete len:326 (+) comp23959_c0_seq1:295-1272(+)